MRVKGGTGGCEWLGNIGGVPTCAQFSTGWDVEYSAWTNTYCGSGTLLGTATGSPAACSGSAVCQHNYKTPNYGLAPDSVHLSSGSLLNQILPAGLSWLPPTDIDGDPRSTSSSPGDDD